jgi:TonB-linked SusC/RagA family outer membrane protein
MQVPRIALAMCILPGILVAAPTGAGAAVAAPAAEWTDATDGAAVPRVGVIRGRVTDEAGEPLDVVQVTVVGTTFSSVTNASGEYMILNVPPGLYTLRATRLGFAEGVRENVRVTDGGTVVVNIGLRMSALMLDEIVATGVADPTSARRVPFTVGRISGEVLQAPTDNAISSIQGRISGVNITTPAQPGAGINILLRSPTSISRSNTPLFVVDGVILASTFGRSSADLSALDIESIEVVKGAAAASLYGSRAAAGVVQIRTRRGAGLEAGQTRVTVRSELGVSSLNRRISLARHHNYLTNAQGQYIDAAGNVVDRVNRIQRPVGERFLDVPYTEPIYDHLDQFFDPGQFMTNTVTLAQNSDRTNFFTSFSNNRNSGVVLEHDGYSRNDVRINLDHRIAANLQVSVSGFHMRSEREELPSETFRGLVQQQPDVNLLQPDPIDGAKYIWWPDDMGVVANPLYELVTSRDDESRARTLASSDIRWSPLGWVSMDANVSYDRSDRTTSFFFPRGRQTINASWREGVVDRGQGLTTALNGSISTQFRGSWNDLSGRLTLRALAEKEDYEVFSARANNLTVEGVPDLNAGAVQTVGGSTQEIAAQGFFVATNVDFRGRYIVDALVRRDGSSLFGPEERWHTYYRTSAAWRMAEEPWWPVGDINEFKLRYSRGTAGGRPNYGDRFETYSFADGGGLVKGTLGNRFLKPERSLEQEFGVDMIFRNRVSLQLTHARTKTEDQLVSVPLPAAFGFSNQWQNAGTMEGSSWEATLEATALERPGLRWTVGLVADRSQHEITEYNRRCFRTGTASAFFRCAGERLGTMYGTRFLRSLDELSPDLPRDQFQVNDDGLVVWVGAGGNWRNHQWGATSEGLDINYGWGLPILQRDEAGTSAVVRIGDTNPDFNWGFSSNLQWRDLTVYGLLNSQVGGVIYNRTKQRMYQYNNSGDADQAGRPQELKKTTDYYGALYAGNLVNEYFVEDASYVKLREVSVRYRMPAAVLSHLGRIGVDGLTAYVSGRNLITWTGYTGFDPEAGTPLSRMDDFVYPQFRTITTGLEIRF